MTIIPTQHSSLVGGSTAARRIGCPRSYTLEQLVHEDNRSSVYALEGSALHEMFAIALEKDIEPTTLLPFVYADPKSGESFTVTQNLWEDKGETALASFDTFVAEQEERLGEPMALLVEKRVEFPGIPGAFGTSDIIARCGNEIFIMDWKCGRGIVPAEENKQLMFYACGALNTARSFFEGMALTHQTPVTMVILQPALSKGIDVWRTDMLRLHHFEVELHGAIQAIENEGIDAKVQDGPWCRFARCKSVCPLHLGAAAKLASKFDDLQSRLAAPAKETNNWPERWADLLDLVDLVEGLCSDVRERAHEAAEQGMEIPGYVLEMKRPGPRHWNCEERDVQAFLEGEGLDLDDIAPRKVLTLPQAEKILKKDGKTIPDEYVTRPEPSGTKLVRASKATEPVEGKAKKAATLAEKLMRL